MSYCHRLPTAANTLQWVLTLMLVVALPATAQVKADRPTLRPPVVDRADLRAKPILAINAQQSEAEAIALASPSLREAARRLKLRGLAATVAIPALRSVFRSPDRETFQALVAAGFTKPQAVDAFHKLDRPDVATLRATLSQLGESMPQTAVHLHRLYPELSFDALFRLLMATASLDDSFRATALALGLDAGQIVATSANYFHGRHLQVGGGAFYPDVAAVASMVRSLHPSTPQSMLWSRLLLAGYAPVSVFAQLPVGDVDRSGRALDAVGGCIAQRFPGRRIGTNPAVEITIAMDESGSHDPRQAECYAIFLQSQRSQSVTRALAEQIADEAVTCRPAQSPACPALRLPVLASILEGAGYPPEKR